VSGGQRVFTVLFAVASQEAGHNPEEWRNLVAADGMKWDVTFDRHSAFGGAK
jgi:hypothetical protein